MTKTFRQLERGDKILVKNITKHVPCNVTIDDHHYITEVVSEDKTMTIDTFSHYDNGLGGKLVEFYAYPYLGVTLRFEMAVDDLDKTETEKYKILDI